MALNGTEENALTQTVIDNFDLISNASANQEVTASVEHNEMPHANLNVISSASESQNLNTETETSTPNAPLTRNHENISDGASIEMPPKIRRFSSRIEDLVKLHAPEAIYVGKSFMVNFEYASSYVCSEADWIGLYEIVEDIKPTSYSSTREAVDLSPASSDDCAEGNLQTPVMRRQGQQLIFDSDDSTASSAGDLHASQNINIGQNVSTSPIAAATENSGPMTDAATSTGLTNHPGSLPADSLGNQNISVDRTTSSAVGDRFYVATAERRKKGLKWEAECGASECGLYELRYYNGPGTQRLVAKSKPIRALRQFCSIC